MRHELASEIRAYVGALPVAAALLALVVSTAVGATTPGSARAASLSADAGLPVTSPSAVPQAIPGLFPGAGYEPGGSPLVRDLQRLLVRTGYRPGAIDGRYGPLTERAVRHAQAERGLLVDGIAGRQTVGALESRAPALFPSAGYEPGGSPLVGDLQRRLTRMGYGPGPINGRYGPLTERAVRRFQAHRGLPVDGIAGAQTFADLRTERRAYPATFGNATYGRPHGTSVPATVPRGTARPVPRARPAAEPLSLGWVLLVVAAGLGLLVTGAQHVRRGRRDGGTPSIEVRGDGDQSAGVVHDANHAPLEANPALEALTDMNGSGGASGGADLPGEADAAFNLGVLLEEQDDLAGAESAYRRADARGHAAAASNLGVLLEGQGDLVGAQAAYRRADERGEANGAFNLGVLLEEQGDVEGAESAYRRADARGHAAAASNLGVLLEAQGELAGAEAAYRRADDRGEANGAFNLGVLLEEQGDLAGAEPAYRRAADAGQAKVAQLARAALLDLRGAIQYAGASRNGDPDGA